MKKFFSVQLMAAMLAVFSLMTTSCEKDEAITTQGQLLLSFEIKETQLKAAIVVEPAAIVATIADSHGKIVSNNVSMPLFKFNSDYVTKALTLDPGTYQLVEYYVVDASNNVIYITPKTGSAKASWVSKPLPIAFTVAKDQVTKLAPEVVSTANSTPADFGYATFRLNIVNGFDFLIAVFAYNDNIKSYDPVSANVTVADSTGKTLATKNIPALTDTISVPDGKVKYIVSVTKEGYQTHVDTIAGTELKKHFAASEYGPLKVYLVKTAANKNVITLTTDQTTLKAVSLGIYFISDSLVSVDWGDGSKLESFKNATISQSFIHNYTKTGVYNILISTDFTSSQRLQVSYGGSNLIATDFTKALNLGSLILNGVKLTKLDVSKNLSLSRLWVPNNDLSSIDLSSNTNLQSLYLDGNKLQSLDITNCKMIQDLGVTNNSLSTLDISMLNYLISLSCYRNNITTLNTSNCPNLLQFDCSENKISKFDLSNNTKLTSLRIGNNPISKIDLSKNNLLETLVVQGCNLTEIDLSNNVELSLFSSYKTPLVSLDITNNKKLKNIYVNGLEFDLNAMNKFYLDLYNNVASKNILNGTLWIGGISPTGSALQAKQDVIKNYGWKITAI